MSAEAKSVWARRALFQATAAAIGAAAATIAAGAAAAPKISKAAVAYQNHPDGDRRCGKCLQFQPPASCKVVDGPVSPEGYCRIFMAQRQA